ncbi:30S ribosomal protein S3 [Candidatus Falkowbacteria bacterium RIFOXYB2_FULL_38_15]|uniref:Small ribosomal subunit protein uS3 n=1 Tax=Candidatus Falkowbacteria bacterium RIFOXYA2_FULL_38_12 TaxID=1797993 RepID=A0A1F5S2X5_9BACT|nr:MAG: 30S ribosomal protein S3 [Candidatus Falkowbacteria bacterium RIFOXYA2_FULL_38_12]OGF33134.1 MAG: 30S ribosomal protein S3 [Candidatus Falkowbacteria bacterium RIFOXYB2_FULL_38_15]OGF43824.1 MAG: 30S ribosomal protein S3 [Candidatus Falkowbacteria bacterium RIFOXYD2_FULL_39_16]
MGQKVHPKIFRIGQNLIYTWDSKWFSKKNYAAYLEQDVLVKRFLKKTLKEASVAKIEIERTANVVTIIIHSAKPGIIIGHAGKGIEELRKKVKDEFADKKTIININVQEVQNPSLSAEVVLSSMIADIEKRIPFRRVMKQTISKVERAGSKGVKVIVSGRLDGAEIAREEMLALGKIPLHTLRADIDYAGGRAATIYGAIGIKVWIYKGEIFTKK